MQNYTYSIFSIVAIALHLIFNWSLLFGRKPESASHSRYRWFLFGVLAYYLTDASWGIFAGLHWIAPWYADTVFFFLSLVVFAFMWCRFVSEYLGLDRKIARVIDWCGYSLLALNLVALAVNPFCKCLFYFDDDGVYRTGGFRDPAFYLLIAYCVFASLFALHNAFRNTEAVRRRSVMAFTCYVSMSTAMVMQVIWPLTPFTSLGCLIGCCFFHVFSIQDERMMRHMAELEGALDRARAAEKARNMFFSIVSHDIRTPLNAILGYSEVLRKGASDPAEREEALHSIQASGTTLLQLVNDVLDLAKMDSGRMALNLEPVRISSLTDEVFSSFWRTASGKGINLVNKTEGVPVVMLDGHRFRQILFNLTGNAVKFTESGAVTVSASYAGGNLEVAVSDTGCGIPENMLTRIFDPFVQVLDRSHAPDRVHGSGLGLSICKGLVETMGGVLSVESEAGKGSTFRVRIPGVQLSREGAEPAAAPSKDQVLQNVPGHVLVVDDSKVNRSVLTALLKKLGISSIDQAGDGAEALAAIESAARSGRPFEFVFSDFWMPNEKLRADPRFSGLPVFALTADTEFHSDDRSKLFSGILFKPIDSGKLVSIINSQLHSTTI